MKTKIPGKQFIPGLPGDLVEEHVGGGGEHVLQGGGGHVRIVEPSIFFTKFQTIYFKPPDIYFVVINKNRGYISRYQT
jgi:hypothetical protein